MNTGTASEIIAVKILSAKRINLLFSLQPFEDQTDSRQKIDNNNNDQRNKVTCIMEKCKKSVQKFEDAVIKDDKL